MRARLLLISPVRDEAVHIEAVARAIARQTRPPDCWIVVDDGSTDGTQRLLEAVAPALPFLRTMSTQQHERLSGTADRLDVASEASAFNLGLNSVDWRSFTHIGKLDGDVELPVDYFERILERFAGDPRLGIACGDLVEGSGQDVHRIRIPSHHVHGALKLYTRECFEAIGGMQERLGWDTIDETYARMLGFATRSYPDVVAHHHRSWGSAGGTLRGRARHGRCAYVAGYPLFWVMLRSAKLATVRPVVLSGLAFGFGYLRAWAARCSRVEDPQFRRYVRRELAGRLVKPLRPSST
jgi:glycosyltransferase involved in cell wall biosynthesis